MPQTGVRTNIFGIGEVYELQREGQWVEKNRESFREYGYFGGGVFPGGSFSIVNRIDYSNDTIISSIRGPLSITRPGLQNCGVGNYNFGYYGGGGSGGGAISSIDRINYSNDLSFASQRSFLSLSRFVMGSTGNSNFGYFGGGLTIPYSIKSTVDRIDYNNDTLTARIRTALSAATMYLSATGNSNFGYFGGGSPTRSTVERINYNNDIVLPLQRGSLSSVRFKMTSSSSKDFGYFVGGPSRIDRISYSNDTSNASVRSFLSISRSDLAGTGNSNFGYFGGGGPAISTIERIDYSNDTSIPSIRGPLSRSRGELAATSSASFGGAPVSYLGAPWTATSPFGYFGGGYTFPGLFHSTVDRIDYSNDTETALIKGPLSLNTRESRATGNSNFGYFGGGSKYLVLDFLQHQ